jgi:hypothetical protein
MGPISFCRKKNFEIVEPVFEKREVIFMLAER